VVVEASRERVVRRARSVRRLTDAGAQLQREIKGVGEGKLIASVKDVDGNVIGLLQSP
jgi:predicted enzyme related to lactoylglutathione lyase